MTQPGRSFVEILRRVPLFNELSEIEIRSIAGGASSISYESGEVVFLEGERGGDLLIVAEGAVKILKTAANGRHQLIAIERSGSSLGEVSVFEGGPYSTTAITATSVVLLRIRGERLHGLCLTHPEVGFKVIRVLGHRLRHLRRLVEDLSFATVRDRLIAHLLNLAAERGIETETGIQIELDENNEELAARLGTVRELVSRNLGRLHGDGLIEMRRRAVTIPNESRLRAAMGS